MRSFANKFADRRSRFNVEWGRQVIEAERGKASGFAVPDKRILKRTNGVTLTELTLFTSAGRFTLAYSVDSARTNSAKGFERLTDAEAYFAQEVLRSA